jgi:hypothetical protein
MASNKKPSIYSDRGSIGSAEELDEYGVWVKSEPQILSVDGSAENKSSFDDSLFEEANFEKSSESTAAAAGDESLNSDGAVLDVNEAPADSTKFADVEFPDDNVEIGNDEPMAIDADLDDFNMPEDDTAPPDSGENIEIEDTNFDEFEAPGSGEEESAETEVESEDIAIETDNFNSEEPSIDDLTGEDIPTDDFASEDATADDSTSEELSSTDDFAIGEDAAGDSANTEPENESLESEDLEMSDFDVPTVKSIENNIDNIKENFDDAANEGNLSTHLLMKIANELSSIRGELSELKKEFSLIRSPLPEEEKHEHSGFFQEEEDETIALTGDELDNIVNSADFTEESGTNETPEQDFPMEDESADVSSDLSSTESEEEPAGDDLDIDDSLSMDDIDLAADDFGDDSEAESESAAEDDTAEEEPAADDIAEDDLAADDIAEEELATDDITEDDLAIDDIAEEEPAADITEDDIAEEEPAADDIAEDDLAAGDTAEEEDDIAGISPEEMAGIIDDDLIDIDTDGLDIDMDSDTILDEQDETEAAEESEITEESEDAADELSVTDSETESSGEDSSETDFDDISAEEIDSALSDADLSDDIFADSSESAESENEESENAEIEIDSEKDSEELEKLRTEGAVPVTFAPDNTSYLEEDSEFPSDSDGDFASDSFDLSNAVIDEPDLSAEGINDNLDEPSLNKEEFDLDSLDDLTIDNSGVPASEEEETAVQDDDEVSFDIDDSFGSVEETEEQASPEGFEEETEDQSVSLDDTMDDDFAIDSFEEETPAEEEAPEEAPAPQKAAPVQAVPAAKDTGPSAGVQAVSGARGGVKGKDGFQIPSELKMELKNILSYMDQLLESLPEEKIEEFAKSEYFDSYKKLFKELGLV